MDAQAITQEWIMQKVATRKPFTILLLLAGKDLAADEETANRWQMAHLAHLFTLEKEGEASIFGPVLHDPRVRGMIVFNTTNKGHIRQLMAPDPYVKEGYLVYELPDWFSIPGPKLPG